MTSLPIQKCVSVYQAQEMPLNTTYTVKNQLIYPDSVQIMAAGVHSGLSCKFTFSRNFIKRNFALAPPSR